MTTPTTPSPHSSPLTLCPFAYVPRSREKFAKFIECIQINLTTRVNWSHGRERCGFGNKGQNIMEIFHRREQPEKWGMWSKRVKRPPVELRFHCQRNVTTNYHPPLSLANLEMDKQIKTSWFLFLCKCKPLKKLHISESSSKRDLFHLTQRNDESGQFCLSF